MARIELPKESRERLARDLAEYLKRELQLDVGAFDALFLLDHLSATLGPHFYDQGVRDARAVLEKRVEEISEAIAGLERG